ncbi:HipA domain-containing protein [Caldimonas brevitalea]|uniref:Serine/threonine-protein kinase HipA n=1 Tax=Caldimonas brevitalea TaxID=413882 RepID=A0A0G3BUQ4_9BURK|nr:HipA domain-containing protein [Caldimonas brevitalea]AKJ31101.1 serine/threonine-protein kinase HipA [Caldimonas brevitalea]
MSRALVVYLNDRRVGLLQEHNDLWAFEYDREWASHPTSFDLSPALSRQQTAHADGATLRPVQWYFDNLLPEEGLREAISSEAKIRGDDAFALLEYLGAESAGSLTLLPPGQPLPPQTGLQALPDAELSRRIARLPRSTLTAEAPKRMSIAGAQHKLPVVLQDGQLFEPIGATPSTHILKPNHPSADYAASAVNEFVTMRLARAFGLKVPTVHLRYVPEAIYLVERFDRVVGPGGVQRRHIIDACQLLNKARTFKYTGQSVTALNDIVSLTRHRIATRQALFRWLLFNLAIGNDDCHLKNLSFLVSHEGIDVAPHYDLLSTCAYRTPLFAERQNASWSQTALPYPLAIARSFDQVTCEAVEWAADELRVGSFGRRQIHLLAQLPAMLQALAAEVHDIRDRHPDAALQAAGESRLLRVIEHIVLRDMLTTLRVR